MCKLTIWPSSFYIKVQSIKSESVVFDTTVQGTLFCTFALLSYLCRLITCAEPVEVNRSRDDRFFPSSKINSVVADSPDDRTVYPRVKGLTIEARL